MAKSKMEKDYPDYIRGINPVKKLPTETNIKPGLQDQGASNNDENEATAKPER